MFNAAKRHLTNLGLRENEALVYLACLQYPTGTSVHELVSATNIKRSSVDLILDRLRKRGFIQRHKEGKRWFYRAETPENIVFSIEERTQDFKQFLPVFMQSMTSGAMPSVRFYEGLEGVNQVFDDILLSTRLSKSNNELLTISSGKDLIKLIPGHQLQFVKKRIREQIPLRILAPESEFTRKLFVENERALRSSRFFDEKQFNFKMEIDIYADKVALLTFSEPRVMGTVIENKEIADSMRSIFELIWLSSTLAN